MFTCECIIPAAPSIPSAGAKLAATSTLHYRFYLQDKNPFGGDLTHSSIDTWMCSAPLSRSWRTSTVSMTSRPACVLVVPATTYPSSRDRSPSETVVRTTPPPDLAGETCSRPRMNLESKHVCHGHEIYHSPAVKERGGRTHERIPEPIDHDHPRGTMHRVRLVVFLAPARFSTRRPAKKHNTFSFGLQPTPR